jgi:hypothetical protein
VREAAVREALGHEEHAVATFPVDASRGRGAGSGLRFGDRGIVLVTAGRLIVLAVNLGPRPTINPLVFVVSLIVHGLAPVRMPYVLIEAPLADVNLEIKAGLSGRYVSLGVAEGAWALRFARADEAAAFVRLVGAKR